MKLENPRTGISIFNVLNELEPAQCRLYNYFLRDFHLASLELILGVLLLSFGVVFGSIEWVVSASRGITASAGTVMLSALPIIVGIQMLLSALNYDMANIPQRPLHLELHNHRSAPPGDGPGPPAAPRLQNSRTPPDEQQEVRETGLDPGALPQSCT